MCFYQHEMKNWGISAIMPPYVLLSVGLLWPQGHLAQGGWGSLLSHQHDRLPGREGRG